MGGTAKKTVSGKRFRTTGEPIVYDRDDIASMLETARPEDGIELLAVAGQPGVTGAAVGDPTTSTEVLFVDRDCRRAYTRVYCRWGPRRTESLPRTLYVMPDHSMLRHITPKPWMEVAVEAHEDVWLRARDAQSP